MVHQCSDSGTQLWQAYKKHETSYADQLRRSAVGRFSQDVVFTVQACTSVLVTLIWGAQLSTYLVCEHHSEHQIQDLTRSVSYSVLVRITKQWPNILEDSGLSTSIILTRRKVRRFWTQNTDMSTFAVKVPYNARHLRHYASSMQ